jgi:hypothetical protein
LAACSSHAGGTSPDSEITSVVSLAALIPQAASEEPSSEPEEPTP